MSLTAVPGGTIEPIAITLMRNTKGVLVHVKTSPEVEAFFRDLSRDSQVNVSEMGRHWAPMLEDAESFKAYYSTKGIEVETSRGVGVTFNRIGYPLSERLDGYESLNLSFLKLVGTSREGGLTFQLKGTVMTYDQLKKLQSQMVEACRAFYVNYLKPVELSVIIRTQEVRF